MAETWGGGRNRMDTVKEGSAVVPHEVGVCSADKANEIIDVDFQEAGDFFRLDLAGEIMIFEDWL
jgi:hypothetical protein